MDVPSQKKAFCSKTGLIIVATCVGVLLYSIRNIIATHKQVASLESQKYEVLETKSENRRENLVLSDSICLHMKPPTEDTDVRAYPGIRINEVIKLIQGNPQLISGYKNIILHLGTNNVAWRDPLTKTSNYTKFSAGDVKELYIKLCDQIRSVNPNCTILASAILPRPRDHNITWSKVAEINSFLEATFGSHFIASSRHFMKSSDVDKKSSGTILEEYYHPDGLHLTEKGKDLLAEVFRKSLSK